MTTGQQGAVSWPHTQGRGWYLSLTEYLDVPHLTEAILYRFADPKHLEPRALGIALAEPRTPAGALLELGEYLMQHEPKDAFEDERKRNSLASLASHPNTPPTILSSLNIAGIDEVHISLTSNPRCPSLLLAAMSTHRNWKVRYGVAIHPNTPLSVLLNLSKDTDSAVTEGLLGNPSLPIEILLQLLGDNPSLPQLHAASRHPQIGPQRISEWLEKHPWLSLQRVLAGHPNLPQEEMEKLLWSGDEIVQKRLAENVNLPESLASELARSHMPEEVRISLSSNSKLDVDIAYRLLTDTSPEVRFRAARHPGLTASMLAEALAEETDMNTQNKILSHPNLEEKAIFSYLNRINNAKDYAPRLFGGAEEYIAERKTLSSDLMQELIAGQDRFILARLLRRAECTEELLSQHVTSEDPNIRGSIAANLETPQDILNRLATDSSPVVRFLSCAHPRATEEMRVLSFLQAS